ncbi:MAG: adenosine kinase [Pseudomonadota bacterium]
MYDVFGLGNALVDTEVNIQDSFLQEQSIAKGHMTLIESDRREELESALAGHEHTRCSGGSAANTTFAIQGFGLKTAYTCKVAEDPVGTFFMDELQAAGIDVNTSAMATEGQSGQCFIMITPDAERTMCTDLAISSQLGREDVSEQALINARQFYVEGYLSSSEPSTQAAIHCREQAEQNGVGVAVSLSDPSMVEFFRSSLELMLGNGVTQVFCNEEEALAWAKTDRLDIAINELKDIAPEVYVTLGAQGSIAVTSTSQRTEEGFRVKAIDTTGAGDIYAGAVLAARLKGAEPGDAAKFANYCAAQIVSRYGARFKTIEEYAAMENRFPG